MNWKLKSLIRRSITSTPGGHHLYRWLTSKVLGMQAGMATKWFRVIPNHVKVMQDHFGPDARDVSMWCNKNVDDECEDNELFIPSEKFIGEKIGFVFKMDENGLGYYKDKVIKLV